MRKYLIILTVLFTCSMQGQMMMMNYYSLSSIETTGGTITYDGDSAIHTFTTSGDFVSSIARNIRILVVAGGGAGGRNMGGGGGAGGIIHETSVAILAQTYSITVGAGGPSPESNLIKGYSGNNSAFSSLYIAIGGGGGGSYGSKDGADGGSGGGAMYSSTSDQSGGNETTNQGNNGASTFRSVSNKSGGGGGKGEAGSLPYGGDGLQYNISGSTIYYGGGGGGIQFSADPSSGGQGGGGDGSYVPSGSWTNPTDGTDGLGSGGGANANNAATGTGGDGKVIIKYKYK